jgi:hypothetical protein
MGNLEIEQDRGHSLESERNSVAAVAIESDRSADIFLSLLEGQALGDDRSIDVIGSVDSGSVQNIKMHDRFHIDQVYYDGDKFQ